MFVPKFPQALYQFGDRQYVFFTIVIFLLLLFLFPGTWLPSAEDVRQDKFPPSS